MAQSEQQREQSKGRDLGLREGIWPGDLGLWLEQGSPSAWMSKRECFPTSPQVDTSKANVPGSHTARPRHHRRAVKEHQIKLTRPSDEMPFLPHLRKAGKPQTGGPGLEEEAGSQRESPEQLRGDLWPWEARFRD